MAQFAEAGTHDTVGMGPSTSAAVKETTAVPSLDTRLDGPRILSVGALLPSRSIRSASRLARYCVSTRNGTCKRNLVVSICSAFTKWLMDRSIGWYTA